MANEPTPTKTLKARNLKGRVRNEQERSIINAAANAGDNPCLFSARRFDWHPHSLECDPISVAGNSFINQNEKG